MGSNPGLPYPLPEPSSEPVSVAASREIPEEFLGRDGYQRRQAEMPSEPPPGFSHADGEWVRVPEE